MQRHHILGVAFVPDVWVWVCARPARNDCHGELTRLQRDCGVVLDHGAERTEPETAWTLVAGWAAILSVSARRSPDPRGVADAALILRFASALGLAVDEFAVRLGWAAMAGPDPRGSAVRATARERKRASRQPRYRQAPGPPAPHDERDILAVLLCAVAGSLGRSVAVDAACQVVVAELERFADRSPTLLANLAELERRGRLEHVLAVARDQLAADRDALLTIPATLNDDAFPQQLVPDLSRTAVWARASWELTGELCATDSPAALERVVDTFLARVGGLPGAA
jgi:hypothetical protein